MKKLIVLYIISMFIFPLFASEADEMMNKIGYKFKDELNGNNNESTRVDDYPITYFSKLEQLSMCEGGLSLSGNTGLIELPSAFIVSHNYYNIGTHLLYTNNYFNMQNTRFKSKKWEAVTHLNYGFRRNAECGLNIINVKNDIKGELTNYFYRIRKDFVTFNIKWSTPFKGKAVAFGIQYTNLTNEEQLLMDYMDLEKMNGYYVSISDQVSPRLFTTFVLKNTFIRSVDIPPIKLDRTDLTIAGAGIEYRWGYTSILAEAKKLYGTYINDGNDFSINVGARYRHWRTTLDFMVVNLNNGSDAVYTGGLVYSF